ncbi:hypothetical protein AOLI_G00056250 [Acnodon oligacanthus]
MGGRERREQAEEEPLLLLSLVVPEAMLQTMRRCSVSSAPVPWGGGCGPEVGPVMHAGLFIINTPRTGLVFGSSQASAIQYQLSCAT